MEREGRTLSPRMNLTFAHDSRLMIATAADIEETPDATFVREAAISRATISLYRARNGIRDLDLATLVGELAAHVDRLEAELRKLGVDPPAA